MGILLRWMLLLLVAAGCVGNPEPPESRLVVEGVISTGGYPVVTLSRSITPSGGGGALEDALVRWGKVTISDGDTTVILTGGPDSSQLPPYSYYSYGIRGEAGRTYVMEAEYGENRVRSISRMMSPTPVDSINVSRIEGNDTLRRAVLWFTAPDDCPAYYVVRLRKSRSKMHLMPCLFGTVAATQPGVAASVPVFMPKMKFAEGHYDSDLHVGDTLEIALSRVERDVYDFWRAYSNVVVSSSGADFLGAPPNLPGNITGGYGIWGAEAHSLRTLIVR